MQIVDTGQVAVLVSEKMKENKHMELIHVGPLVDCGDNNVVSVEINEKRNLICDCSKVHLRNLTLIHSFLLKSQKWFPSFSFGLCFGILLDLLIKYCTCSCCCGKAAAAGGYLTLKSFLIGLLVISAAAVGKWNTAIFYSFYSRYIQATQPLPV